MNTGLGYLPTRAVPRAALRLEPGLTVDPRYEARPLVETLSDRTVDAAG
jgi:hypothetical protein